MGCPVTENFSIGSTKVSFLVGHGPGPVVQKELLKDINTENLYKLLLDEIWYVDSKFYVHVKAGDIYNKVIDIM